jgi:hypothetical protein
MPHDLRADTAKTYLDAVLDQCRSCVVVARLHEQHPYSSVAAYYHGTSVHIVMTRLTQICDHRRIVDDLQDDIW